MMPRFGMELDVSAGFERIAWFGRGPAETYVDRAFERVGVYSSTVSAEWVEYSRPQANGNKIDVRWVEFTNDKGVGLRAEGMPLLSMEARHVSQRDIEQAAYTWQLTQRPQVFLNLDLRQMGAGGIDSWSRNAYPMEPYRIPGNQAYSYSFTLKPIAGKSVRSAGSGPRMPKRAAGSGSRVMRGPLPATGCQLPAVYLPNRYEYPTSKSHCLIDSVICCWPGASRGFGPVTVCESARVTATWSAPALPIAFVTPPDRCWFTTAGQRMLSSTSDSGIGWSPYRVPAPHEQAGRQVHLRADLERRLVLPAEPGSLGVAQLRRLQVRQDRVADRLHLAVLHVLHVHRDVEAVHGPDREAGHPVGRDVEAALLGEKPRVVVEAPHPDARLVGRADRDVRQVARGSRA